MTAPPEAPAAATAPSAEMPRHRRWLWLLGAVLLLAGSVAGALVLRQHFVPATDYRQQTEQMAGIAAKIDQLGTPSALPAPAANAPATAAPAAADDHSKLASRVAQLEARLAAPSADVVALEQRLETLDTTLQSLTATLHKLSSSSIAADTLFRLTVHQQAAMIAERVNQGEAFLPELELLQHLGQQASLALPVAQMQMLVGVARFGVPSSRTLAAELDSLASTVDLVIPADKPAKVDNEITGALASFINLRRIDGVAGEQRKEALAVIDTARDHLRSDNIPAALETITGLPDMVQDDIAYESWTERAQLALKARDAAGQLQDLTARLAMTESASAVSADTPAPASANAPALSPSGEPVP
jgi:hypothetical protein